MRNHIGGVVVVRGNATDRIIARLLELRQTGFQGDSSDSIISTADNTISTMTVNLGTRGAGTIHPAENLVGHNLPLTNTVAAFAECETVNYRSRNLH
jgi:hypothetical protein